MDERPLTQAEVEAAVRQYLGRVARRYVPLAVGLAVLLIVVLTVPSVSQKDKPVAATGNQAAPGQVVNNDTSATTVPGVDATALAGVVPGGLGGSTGAGTRALPTKITPPAAFGAKGKTRSGLECGPDVKQVTWTVYAPPCIPAYVGNNGGITSPGVTKDNEITAVFRRTNSAEEKAAFAAVGDAAPGTDDQYLADLRTYADFFNKTYELYGRHLIVRDFNGQGDNLEEDQGRMLEGAQQDGRTARQTYNGFMDLSSSPTLASTQPYEEALAANKVIAIGAVGLPQSWFKQYSPWEYSIAPDGTKAVTGAVHGLCQRLSGMNAIFSGSPAYQNTKRKFGLVAPENEQYQKLADQLENGIKAECGETLFRRDYSINIATMAEQSVNVMAQMQSQNVSHLVCICDPVVEIFFADTAEQQRYYPEWAPTAWLDPQGREIDNNNGAPNEWVHAMAGQWIDFPPKAQSEAYRVFKLANPNGEPQEQYYAEAYWTLLYVYSALQLAGPNLTPQTFQQGVFSMPRTPTGMFGTWAGGKDAFSPTVDVQVSYWSHNATSNFDGKQGAWIPCENHKWFVLDDPASFGPKGTQPHCFGK